MSAQNPTSAILIIGSEILSGRTQDVNVQFLATRLSKRGINLCEVRVVPDEKEEIVLAVNALRKKYNFVFTTGGIGPTHDDITADCIAAAFGVAIDVHPEAKERLEKHYAHTNTELNDARLRMARIPAGAILVDNPVSGAPGFKIENVVVMAGVPKIMQSMFDHVETMLPTGLVMLSTTVNCTMREGDLAEGLSAAQNMYPEVEIGSYPVSKDEGYTLSLVLRSTNKLRLTLATEAVMNLIRDRGQEPQIISLRS